MEQSLVQSTETSSVRPCQTGLACSSRRDARLRLARPAAPRARPHARLRRARPRRRRSRETGRRKDRRTPERVSRVCVRLFNVGKSVLAGRFGVLRSLTHTHTVVMMMIVVRSPRLCERTGFRWRLRARQEQEPPRAARLPPAAAGAANAFAPVDLENPAGAQCCGR
jgi:hypothetical protein